MKRWERVMAKATQRIEEMRKPLTQIDLDEIFEEIDTEDTLEITENANRYHCVTDWENDPDPIEE